MKCPCYFRPCFIDLRHWDPLFYRERLPLTPVKMVRRGHKQKHEAVSPKQKEKEKESQATGPESVALGLEDIPDGVNEKVWSILQQIDKNTAAAAQRISVLENNVSGLTATVTELTDDVAILKRSVSLLTAKLSRTERSNNHLKKELTEIKARSMADNLIFTCDGQDYREAKGESCVSLVRHFLVNVLGIKGAVKYFIPEAHRTGSRRPDKPRQIIARIPVNQERREILDNTKRLKGTRHFVSRQLPLEVRERQQFALTEFKEKRTDPSQKATMVREKLFLKGELQTKYLPPTLPVSMDTNILPEIDIQEGGKVQDEGSTFLGYAARVTSREKIRQVRDQLLVHPKTAGVSDIIYAFRIGNDKKMSENFDSDWDPGIGLALLRWMKEGNLKNTVCFATRTCYPGYKHIGDRRFQHSITVCDQAVKKL